MKIFFLAVLLCAAQFVMSGQAKIYTRKAKLDDFPMRTMEVVVDGESPLALDFRNELSSRWRLSPFEFCSTGDYEKMKGDNGYYFLRLASEDGIVFLLLEKGGKAEDEDRLKRPFELVRIPVGGAGSSFSLGIDNLDVYLDILQSFVQEAMTSDKYGYLGLDAYNARNIKGRRIDLTVNPDDAFAAGEEDVLVPVFFAPEPEGEWCYKMLIDAGTHELFFFVRAKYRKEAGVSFTPLEMKSFELRHAVIPE
ncbi:MAG: hypothetical protein MJY89_02465 [Bacteroidales bacterium]|nr:hypothetical protein [Bacteroidales bacterium]